MLILFLIAFVLVLAPPAIDVYTNMRGQEVADEYETEW